MRHYCGELVESARGLSVLQEVVATDVVSFTGEIYVLCRGGSVHWVGENYWFSCLGELCRCIHADVCVAKFVERYASFLDLAEGAVGGTYSKLHECNRSSMAGGVGFM